MPRRKTYRWPLTSVTCGGCSTSSEPTSSRKGAPSAALRRDRIDRLILLLTENSDEFSAALNADFGNRPHAINLVSEIAGILADMLATRRHLESWMRPQRVRSSTLVGLPTVVEKKPLGVVGIIGPWNFPVGLVVQPAASAFAAGNRVMIKFSEVTSRTAELFSAKVSGLLRSHRTDRGHRRTRGGRGLQRTAVRPSVLHRLTAGRRPGRRGRGTQSGSGHLGTRRQEPGRHRRGRRRGRAWHGA